MRPTQKRCENMKKYLSILLLMLPIIIGGYIIYDLTHYEEYRGVVTNKFMDRQDSGYLPTVVINNTKFYIEFNDYNEININDTVTVSTIKPDNQNFIGRIIK